MLSIVRNVCIAMISFLLFSSFIQKDSLVLPQDTLSKKQDSLLIKDTLLIQYIPVLPRTYQIADAWFIASFPTASKDSNVNILKDYKVYFADPSNGYQLYNKSKSLLTQTEGIIYKIEQKFALPDKDFLFYLILLILFFYGFVRNIYPQYFPKLFSQFSQNSLRMLQNREQLLQNSVASIILNIGFIISFSLIATLYIFNKHLLPISFWEGFVYVSLFFIGLYVGKYVCLEIVGYIFNTRELVSTYIFIVFMVNKVLGILLMPFILLLAFAKPVFHPFAIGGALSLGVLLILYRYLFSLTSVRNKLHISSFHFFLYLCAFEILPLLILYKLVIQYFGGTF